MKRGYIALWVLLVVSLGIFIFASTFETIKIGGVELKPNSFWQELFGERKVETNNPRQDMTVDQLMELADANLKQEKPDTLPKNILFIGDSMLEGLYPRLAAYAKANGHTLNCVIWYSSTTKVWGESTHIPEFIEQFKPDYIFISLGANELFVSDIAKQRDKYVKKMLSEIGDIPYIWIGPPNWKPDTGINQLIASNAKPGTFFLSDGMKFDRSSDGAHPTRQSAALWMDSIVRWMPLHAAHPIKMNHPTEQSARANRVVVLQPNDK